MKFFCSIFILLVAPILQAQSNDPTGKISSVIAVNDFFPLEVGVKKNYSFWSQEQTFYSVIRETETTDSGRVMYTITSKSQTDTSVIWEVVESKSVTRRVVHFPALLNPLDTSFAMNDEQIFWLTEQLDSNHLIQSCSNAPIWQSPLRWRGENADTWWVGNGWNRFSPQDSILILQEAYHGLAFFSDSLVFRKNQGLIYAEGETSKGPNTPYYFSWRAILVDAPVNVSEATTDFPACPVLLQNFPNPFNPTTQIKFAVRGSELVSLKIIDLLGREVAVLVNEEKPSGTYTATWDASNFPSGVYFYRLNVGSFVQTKKLVLMR